METYKASLDKTAKFMTALVFVILIPGIIVSVSIQSFFPGILTLIVPFIIIIIIYPYSITGYTITDDSLIINRRFSRLNKIIPLSDIKSVKIYPEITFAIRLFGNGGFLGYTGLFSSAELGRFRMYSTRRRSNLLYITGNFKNPIVLSPDDTTMAGVLERRLKK